MPPPEFGKPIQVLLGRQRVPLAPQMPTYSVSLEEELNLLHYSRDREVGITQAQNSASSLDEVGDTEAKEWKFIACILTGHSKYRLEWHAIRLGTMLKCW